MVGDFEAASDHIQHRAGRIAMHRLLSVLNADKNEYATNYVDLLLSPRVIEEDGVVTITNSGCLMGEPGTKIVLTFLALVANCYARRGTPSKLFATAGDDQIDADEDPKDLLRYAEASKVTTMVPSTEKWGIFRFQANYCQQLLDIQAEIGMGEIPVPKPRLLSSETKSGRGDQDTNPAYGKSSQFAREYSWCDFERIKLAMVLLFLRNMRHHIEPRPEVFLPREWGGLGLPGIPVGVIVGMLPQWHQTLIAHRELGCPDAKKVLASWSTSRILHRGLLEPDTTDFDDLVSEYLPTANIDQIDLGPSVAPNARYREKLKAARLEGWEPLDRVLSTVKESQTYANVWDINIPTHRGFSTIGWGKRSDRMELISKRFAPLQLRRIPDQPSWQPGTLVLVHDVYGLYQDTREMGGLEVGGDGVNTLSVLPILGKLASPRLFLHYDNSRLILNDTSRNHNSNPRNLQ